MIPETFSPVEQTSVYDGTGTRGNCVAACIASIFSVSIESVEAITGAGASGSDVARWTTATMPHLRYYSIDYCPADSFRLVEGDGEGGEGDRWAYDLPDVIPPAPVAGLWIAHVVSPRGLLTHGPYRGMPLQHAVVFRGEDLAWDPHPQRAQGVGQRVGGGWWIEAKL